jgi:hypothetical protein
MRSVVVALVSQEPRTGSRISDQVRVPEGSAPDLKNKSYKTAADVEIPEGAAEGVIATQGGRFNGWGLYLLPGKPTFHYNLIGVQRTTIADQNRLAPGKHTVVVDFKYDGPGLGKGGTATPLVTARKSPPVISPAPFRFASPRTRRSTSAKTPAHP